MSGGSADPMMNTICWFFLVFVGFLSLFGTFLFLFWVIWWFFWYCIFSSLGLACLRCQDFALLLACSLPLCLVLCQHGVVLDEYKGIYEVTPYIQFILFTLSPKVIWAFFFPFPPRVLTQILMVKRNTGRSVDQHRKKPNC